MIRTERHIIKPGHPLYSECDAVCLKSKLLYNATLFAWRQPTIENRKKYKETGSNENKVPVPTYLGAYRSLRRGPDYTALPDKVAKQTLKLVYQNVSNYYAAIKDYKISPKKYKARPQMPKYKKSGTIGRQVAMYEKGAISSKAFKTGYIALSQTNIKVKTKIRDWANIRQARVIPAKGRYIVEVVYLYEEKDSPPIKPGLVAAIDIGLNNLAVVGFSDGRDPFMVNGRPLKAINQYYNKRRGKMQSRLAKKQHQSKALDAMTNKRNDKVKDYLHKASRALVNRLVSRGVQTLIIGKNPNMKQGINIGRRNNQNFVNIPHSRFIDMVAYKFTAHPGREVKLREESYTSKCSFLDGEKVQKHEVYMGRRKKRGLFVSSNGTAINADLNAAYNIMAKHDENVFRDEKRIGDAAVHPALLVV